MSDNLRKSKYDRFKSEDRKMVLKYNITSCYGFPFVMLFCRLSTISFCDNERGKELYTIFWDY